MITVEDDTKERSRLKLTLEALIQKDLHFLNIKEHNVLDSANFENGFI